MRRLRKPKRNELRKGKPVIRIRYRTPGSEPKEQMLGRVSKDEYEWRSDETMQVLKVWWLTNHAQSQEANTMLSICVDDYECFVDDNAGVPLEIFSPIANVPELGLPDGKRIVCKVGLR